MRTRCRVARLSLETVRTFDSNRTGAEEVPGMGVMLRNGLNGKCGDSGEACEGWVTVALTCCVAVIGLSCQPGVTAEKQPFGAGFPRLDSHATGEWWKPRGKMRARLLVPRDEVLAFAVYTHHRGVLKLTAQLFPLMPDEPRVVRLEFLEGESWKEVARARVHDLGWSAHFRLENWDNSRNVPYRVRFGPRASFEGLVRRDPADKDVIVVGTLSCNSRRTPGPRARIVANLKRQDPDLLFFAGDQSYHHTQHTFGWLEWGLQFRDVLRDRPVITIPDDHDVGQGNIWGENGKKAASSLSVSPQKLPTSFQVNGQISSKKYWTTPENS